jgi:hypothetical protein
MRIVTHMQHMRGEYLSAGKATAPVKELENISRTFLRCQDARLRWAGSALLMDTVGGLDIGNRHMLQFFDALIIAVSARAGATVLLSEDMQDRLEMAGLRVVDRFVAGNEGVIWEVLRG